MQFKSKIFKLGNSVAVYIPKDVYTYLTLNEEYEFEVYTKKGEVPQEVLEEELIAKKSSRPLFCERKHKGRCINATTCGCYD